MSHHYNVNLETHTTERGDGEVSIQRDGFQLVTKGAATDSAEGLEGTIRGALRKDSRDLFCSQ